MKEAIFILSFDCEGKWGMIDMLTEEIRTALTNERLNEVYSDLTKILKLYQINASFAFIGAFMMTISEYQNRRDWFSEDKINGRPWLDEFKKDAESKQFDGWLNPKSLEIIRSSNMHEIAAHGFTHLPLAESLISRNAFLSEMNFMQKVMNLKDIYPRTFVYPRNIVGYPSELKSFGIKGFRADFFQKFNRVMQKPISLLSEFNLLQSAQEHAISEEIIEIPSGYFLNWRSHVRKKIPISVSTQRWKHAIQDAITHKKVIHLWTHPHNFITGDQQFKLFENILRMVSEANKENKIRVLTQNEYCQFISR